jgi:hypothetical protein
MERRHLLLAAMVAAAGLGTAGAAALVASDGETRAAPTSVTVTLAQTATETTTQPATTVDSGVPVPVPALAGHRLDDASAVLQRAGLRREVDGGGVFGVLDDSAWTVCSTTPGAGDRVEPDAVVVVHVDRTC